MEEQIKQRLEQLHDSCSDLIDCAWRVDNPDVEQIIVKQTCIIRDLTDIIKDYVSK